MLIEVVLNSLLLSNYFSNSWYHSEHLKSDEICSKNAGKASGGLIYLHGIDSPIPSLQEQRNRTIVGNIATNLGLDLYIPRATAQCEAPWAGSICWRLDNAAREEISTVELGATKCFSDSKPILALGFSRGGILLSRISTLNLNTSFSALILVGAGGNVPSTGYPANSLPVSILLGQFDKANDSFARNFCAWLGPKCTLLSYEGGHELPEQKLTEVIGSLLASTRIRDTIRKTP